MKDGILCPICGATLQREMIERREGRFCHECDFIDYKNPLPVALATAVRNKDFLLLEGRYCQPKALWASPVSTTLIGSEETEVY